MTLTVTGFYLVAGDLQLIKDVTGNGADEGTFKTGQAGQMMTGHWKCAN
jgi:hypothetical protein